MVKFSYKSLLGGYRMSVVAELHELAKKMNDNPVHIQDQKNRVFQVELDESGTIQMILQDGQVVVVENPSKEPDVTLKLSDSNFSKLLKDELNTTLAFMTGKLKLDGQMGLAMKLQEILKQYQ